MRLLIDAGNTRCKWALEDKAAIVDAGEMVVSALEDFCFPNEVRPDSVLISSVAAQQLRQTLAERVNQLFGLQPVFAQVQQDFAGLHLCYENPAVLGVDRWLAMLAVRALHVLPAVVIDAGSAITVDYLDVAGNHRGGLIIPGLPLLRFALVEKTAAIRLDVIDVIENWQPGCNTATCVSSGVSAMLKGFLVEAIKQAPGSGIVVGGGDAALVASLLSCPAKIDPHLVFHGLMQLA